jgi:pimeloyl-ACP methyl ester carboxylesterase
MAPTVEKAFVNGLNIRYLSEGWGPDLVMLHGLASNLAFWYLRVVPLLAKEFRITVYDLRGHGESDMPARGYTSADMAADLEGLLNLLGISRVHLVGHSFGGAVALHYAVVHPERVRSLTLVDCRLHALQPFPLPKDSPYWRARRKSLRHRGLEVSRDTPKVFYTMVEELGYGAASGLGNEADVTSVTSKGVWNPKARTVQHWLKLRKTTTIAKDMLDSSTLTIEKIRAMRQPTLLMFGEHSRCLKTCERLQKVLPNAETTIVPGAGHFFPLVKPLDVVGGIRNFLAKLRDYPQSGIG